MLFPTAVLTVTGLFHDISSLLIFLSTLSIDVRFSLIHSSHITSSHNGYSILILFPGSFPSLSSILTCGVFLHSLPFCTCADSPLHSSQVLQSLQQTITPPPWLMSSAPHSFHWLFQYLSHHLVFFFLNTYLYHLNLLTSISITTLLVIILSYLDLKLPVHSSSCSHCCFHISVGFHDMSDQLLFPPQVICFFQM